MASFEEVIGAQHGKDDGADGWIGGAGAGRDGQTICVEDLEEAKDLPGADYDGELAHGREEEGGDQDESREKKIVSGAMDVRIAEYCHLRLQSCCDFVTTGGSGRR